jgi:C1A family cysteine protease
MATTHRFGWRPSPPDIRDHPFTMPRRISFLPARVDLRVECPAVYDQGNLGSCTANAAAFAYEFDLKRQRLADFTPSRLFVYYNERVIDGSVSSDSGSYLRTAAKTLNKQGVCDEKAWPYLVSKFARKPTPARKTYTPAKRHVSTSYQALDNTQVDQLRACLASGSPFIFGFTVYESFESAAVAKTGVVPMPSKTEKVLGGHAVACVGYDDAQRLFCVRNSWGADWGAGGYCFMPYDYLTNQKLATDFWQITAVKS